jgi:C4-dicarboxylate-specific signal transduction histidine kinase
MYELNATIEGAGCARVSTESLHSIVENLLGNYAWQARQSSTAVMDLHIRIQSTDGKLLVEFEDLNGKPCVWPERLFEPFWSERGKGRGIGLYQSRQLANAADGSLEVRAAADRPLCFVLTLPAAD